MKLYRLLLRVYPRAFRERYAAEMERTLTRLMELQKQTGQPRRWRMWLGVSWDAVAGGVVARQKQFMARARLTKDPATPGQFRKAPMGGLGMDVRYALRTLVRQPVFAVTAIVTLALGIGANTAIFSVAYGLLLRPLPYPDPDQLVLVWSQNHGRGWQRTDVPLSDAWEWRTRTKAFEDLAVLGRSSPNLTGMERPERLEARTVTTNVLSVFGVQPVLGRDFATADGEPGAQPAAVLMHGFWERRFGGDASIIGRTVTLDGEPHTVIGVTPREFVFPYGSPDLFLPFRIDPATAPRTNHSHVAIARLAPGVTLERAQREVQEVSESLEREFPESNAGWSAHVVFLHADLVGDIGRQVSLVLMGAVGFVLLMACVNVANLLLARANGRRREVAIRAALGAGRGRMIRQLLTESLVLALAGAAIGVVLAFAGVTAIAASMPSDLPGVFHFAVDPPVLLFALALAVGATLVFGLVPAVRASAASAAELREDSRAGTGRRSRRLGGFLVIAQTALAVVLLVGGGVMTRGVAHMQRQDLGYQPRGVLTMRLTPPAAKYAGVTELNAFYDEVLERVRALPGVVAAGTIHTLPLAGSNSSNSYTVPGVVTPEGGYPSRMGYVSPGYFEAMAIRLVRGRPVTMEDRADAPPVAWVNEALVRRVFGPDDPIGRTLEMHGGVVTIVGIVPDMRERALLRPPEPSIYLPVAQQSARSRSLAIRTTSDPNALAAAVQRAIWEVDPDQPVYAVQAMTDLLDTSVSPFRLVATLMLIFALISLLLGAVGIYGVTSFAVVRRTHEIGIRVAMGAERRGVILLIVGEGMRRAAIGLVLGVGAALLLSRALVSLLVGVSATDPATFIVVIVALLIVTFLGAYLPARRAARLDPVRALGGAQL
jgi:putative ABC transport system permease protein